MGSEKKHPPLDQDAREMIVKWALWDAGFCGEQSAERGPVMLKVFELVEAARATGRLEEKQSLLIDGWSTTTLNEAQARISELEQERDSLKIQLDVAVKAGISMNKIIF